MVLLSFVVFGFDFWCIVCYDVCWLELVLGLWFDGLWLAVV